MSGIMPDTGRNTQKFVGGMNKHTMNEQTTTSKGAKKMELF